LSQKKPTILIAEDDRDILDILEFAVTSQIDGHVLTATDGLEAIEQLETYEVDLLICDYNMPRANGGEVYKNLIEKDLPTKYVLCSSEGVDYYDVFKDDSKVFGNILKPDIFEGLDKIITRFSSEVNAAVGQSDSSFIEVPVRLMGVCDQLPMDLYIILEGSQYLKAKVAGSPFNPKDIAKFKEKGAQGIAISRDSLSGFISKLVDCVNARELSTPREKVELAMKTQSIINFVATKFSISKEVVRATEHVLSNVLEEAKKDKDLEKNIKHIIEDADCYLSSHSMLVAFIGCALIEQLPEWRSAENKKKLVHAAFMHDIDLPPIEVPCIQEVDSLYQQKVSMNHAAKTIEVIKHFKFVSDDSIRIVREHHERPDGSGKPRGLKAKQMLPLSLVFIMTHDIGSIIAQAGILKKVLTHNDIDENLPKSQYSDPLSQKCYNAFKMIHLLED
jgi:response regulator RpfG family c-di-GMP phosphodiesterase